MLGRPELKSTYKCLTVRKAVLLMATAPATHRLVCPILACVAGSGERQLRFDVVGDDGVDDVAVDPAVGREVDAHPIGRRRGTATASSTPTPTNPAWSLKPPGSCGRAPAGRGPGQAPPAAPGGSCRHQSRAASPRPRQQSKPTAAWAERSGLGSQSKGRHRPRWKSLSDSKKNHNLGYPASVYPASV